MDIRELNPSHKFKNMMKVILLFLFIFAMVLAVSADVVSNSK